MNDKAARVMLFVGVLAACWTTVSEGAELALRDAWVSGLAGYDTNVQRLSSSNPPAGLSAEGDMRSVLNVGLATRLRADRVRGSLRLNPYFIKYANQNRFDRADMYGTLKSSVRLGDRWMMDSSDKLRFIRFRKNIAGDRTYNNFRSDLRLRVSVRFSTAVHYRFLYRDRSSPNIDTMKSHGVGGSVLIHATDRLSVTLMGRRDNERMDFVFPGGVNGRRLWGDVSLRYQAARSVIILGKYLYQDDETDFPFDAGKDLDKLGDGGETASDDILQNIRFLEDRDFNYRKHLVVTSVLGRIGDGRLIEAFALFQRKNLDEHVLSIPGQPNRRDDTAIVHVSMSSTLANALRLFGYTRFESVNSNDPDHDFTTFTGGIGLRWSVAGSVNDD